MSTHVIDQKARDMAQAAHSSIEAHTRECALQWLQNNKMQTMILRILAWGTVTLIGAMGTVIYMLLARGH